MEIFRPHFFPRTVICFARSSHIKQNEFSSHVGINTTGDKGTIYEELLKQIFANIAILLFDNLVETFLCLQRVLNVILQAYIFKKFPVLIKRKL